MTQDTSWQQASNHRYGDQDSVSYGVVVVGGRDLEQFTAGSGGVTIA